MSSRLNHTFLFLFVAFVLFFISLAFPLNFVSVLRVFEESFQPLYFFEVRLVRVASTFLVGGVIGVAGYLIQVIFRNPIAGPSILGVSSTGTTFAVATILATSLMPTFWILSLSSLTGVGLTVLLWVFLQKKFVLSSDRLLLIGFSLNMLMASVAGLCIALARSEPTKLRTILSWVYGGFTFIEYSHLTSLVLLAFVGGLFVWLYSDQFRLLNLGEDLASLAGVSFAKVRSQSLLAVGFLVGVICAFCGNVPFLGVVAPQIARSVSGYRERSIILNSFLVGAILLMGADFVGRVLFYPEEIETGIICGLITGPMFMFLSFKRRNPYA